MDWICGSVVLFCCGGSNRGKKLWSLVSLNGSAIGSLSAGGSAFYCGVNLTKTGPWADVVHRFSSK